MEALVATQNAVMAGLNRAARPACAHGGKEGISDDVDCILPVRDNVFEGGSKVVFAGDADDAHAQPKRLCRLFERKLVTLGSRICIGWSHHQGDRCRLGSDFVQQFSRVASSELAKNVTPVKLPPGRLRLLT